MQVRKVFRVFRGFAVISVLRVTLDVKALKGIWDLRDPLGRWDPSVL